MEIDPWNITDWGNHFIVLLIYINVYILLLNILLICINIYMIAIKKYIKNIGVRI